MVLGHIVLQLFCSYNLWYCTCNVMSPVKYVLYFCNNTLVEYVDRKEDPLIQVVRTHQHNTDLAVLQTARCLKTEVQKETHKKKASIAEKTKERWHGKRMHGKLPRNLDEKLVDIEQSYRWLKSGDIKGE